MVASVAKALTLTASILSLSGIAITGVYPGIFVLVAVALIPIASTFYAKKIGNKSTTFQRRYFTTFTLIHVLSILIVLWMTFVIVHDRVLGDCC